MSGRGRVWICQPAQAKPENCLPSAGAMFFPMLVLLIKHLARVFDVEILGRVPVEVVTCHVGGGFKTG